ncbi:hypothetical protein Mgra_00004840 [Meloidogyne graminicola]|uniref:Uncharacterized protein n=1 Tax=Meloidogyne graminicola TaxID=189291 RepID=A0A8S9ZQ55_9BILA|nr:hypothetical protein Mgra_00004840 [Meloidogyne graminicola]
MMILLILLINLIKFQNLCSKEILPEKCDCKDWYGACRNRDETWIDEEIWIYRLFIKKNNFQNLKQLFVGKNETIDGFWASCEINDIRQKFELEPRCIINETFVKHVGEEFRLGIFQWLCLETGRWVKGCYFQNETGEWTLLKIGEIGYNGLIKHTCDRYKDNPGVIQYHAEIRDDIPFKNPSNKGINQNLPQLIDKKLNNNPIEWTHQNAAFFIQENSINTLKIRYLPKSRNINKPQIN